MRTRLPVISPELSARLLAAAPERKIAVAVVACELAARAAGLDEGLAERGLAALRKGESDPILAREFEEASEGFDEVYFKFDEEGRRDLSLPHFDKARAAAAFGFCLLTGDDNLEEGIYEAAKSHRDGERNVVAAAFAALNAQST